ncbi:TPA: hypothetical protein ACGO1T_001040 [Streptococcus suis]
MDKKEKLTILYTLAAAVEEGNDEIADALRKKMESITSEADAQETGLVWRNIYLFEHESGAQVTFETLAEAAEFFKTAKTTLSTRISCSCCVDGWVGRTVPNPEFPQWVNSRCLSRSNARRLLEQGEPK